MTTNHISFGSVVLVKDEKNPEADVIDGQQRLTTLTILLATLRDLSTNPRFASELALMIEEPGSRFERVEKPRLALRPATPNSLLPTPKPGSTVQMESMSDHLRVARFIYAQSATMPWNSANSSNPIRGCESRREQLSTLLRFA